MRPALTFVTRDLKPEPRAGAPIRSRRLLAGLSEAFDVTLVTLEHAVGSTHGHTPADDVRAAVPGIDVVTVRGIGAHKRLAQAMSLAAPRSHEWGRYRSAALRDAVREVAARTSARLVHFDDAGVGQVGPVPGPLNVVAPHNVEHRILASTAAASTGVRAAFARLEAAKVAREERAFWRDMDVVVAVSELDAEIMRAGGARDVLVCPNGTDAVVPLAPSSRTPGEPLRLLFVGTGSYWPNEHGVRWLVSEVLPLLDGTLDVTLEVVGRPPGRRLDAANVTYTGSVPDLRPHYERADVVVVPLHHGSGTRLKVIEAMAYGRPLLSTSLGVEGLPVRPGEHYLCADDPAAFAAALRDLASRLEQPDDGLVALRERALEAAAGLSWPQITERLAADYLARVTARTSAEATSGPGARP